MNRKDYKMTIDEVNELCRDIAELTITEYTDIAFDAMCEEMFGHDPRYNGTDWNDELIYWDTL
jgi:hypothetical protein